MKSTFKFLLIAAGMVAICNVGYAKESPPKNHKVSFDVGYPASAVTSFTVVKYDEVNFTVEKNAGHEASFDAATELALNYKSPVITVKKFVRDKRQQDNTTLQTSNLYLKKNTIPVKADLPLKVGWCRLE